MLHRFSRGVRGLGKATDAYRLEGAGDTAASLRGRPIFGPLGAALEVEIQPLVQKVYRRRRMWNGVFARRKTMLLDLLETFGGAPIGGLRTTSAIWPPVLPSDRDSAVRNAVSLVGSGVQSRRSAMAALSEEAPDAELARIQEELASASFIEDQQRAHVGADPVSAPILPCLDHNASGREDALSAARDEPGRQPFGVDPYVLAHVTT